MLSDAELNMESGGEDLRRSAERIEVPRVFKVSQDMMNGKMSVLESAGRNMDCFLLSYLRH